LAGARRAAAQLLTLAPAFMCRFARLLFLPVSEGLGLRLQGNDMLLCALPTPATMPTQRHPHRATRAVCQSGRCDNWAASLTQTQA